MFYCIAQDFFWSIEPVYNILSNLLIYMYLCSPTNMGTLILFCYINIYLRAQVLIFQGLWA